MNRRIRIRQTLNCRIAAYFAPVITALCLVGCSSSGLKGPLPIEQKADQIVVVKSSHTMMLMANGRVLKTYKVALGRGPSGPKVREGDNKTPEGEYVIDQKNAKTRFHLALHISYPNGADKERARKAGVDPGGAIMIHGLAHGFGWLGSVQHEVDWTEGCIAVSNSEIEEIWRLVPAGTPIEIKP
jgi:murein L,D-transpeptidase YafK